MVLYGAAGLVWLLLPGMTIGSSTAVALSPTGPVAVAAAPRQDETSAASLALPLVVAVAASVLGMYGYLRRLRRSKTRTTPGGSPSSSSPSPAGELDERSRDLLVRADDWVRTSREELGFAEARFDAAAVEPFAQAVRAAEAELAIAFRMRRRHDQGVPEDPAARRQALAGVIGRCEEAGRLLDTAADGFDELRGLERDIRGALKATETRFRELTSRARTAEATLAGLARRYAPSATEHVTGYAEQAKDRLMFATTRLNRAHQEADRGESERAAGQLRAAEGAVAQAAVFLDGIERLAAELDEAAAMVPAALSGAEAERAGAAERLTDVPAGEAQARILHADTVLASVRQETTSGRPYDPLDILRRIVEATAPLATGRTGVLSAAALLTARSAAAATADFVTTHRGAVGASARTLLAEAEHLLAARPPADVPHADALAREARDQAEQDVRAHGNPYAEADARAPGAAGAALGGILLLGSSPTATPPSFGGPRTRNRRTIQLD
ncbi:hypothetical protein GCM10009549_36380 [Streptomyces thermoalcalitolerans]|uniref:TPM domain-containing protein n=2 Tax=Streptomyces thermoalcalitolerans TaxID=65605 RepID=A0ABP3ZE51_9ACTN